MTTTLPAPTTTPVQICEDGFWLKRDDLFTFAGVNGGKVRGLLGILEKHKIGDGDCDPRGMCTGTGRSSAQMEIVALVGKHLGIPVVVHCPNGEYTKEMLTAAQAGAKLIQHPAGYTNVIRTRAQNWAHANRFLNVPFGMGHPAAVKAIREEVARTEIPKDVRRIVIPLGSGTNAAGLLWGLQDQGLDDLPVIGVRVGGRPASLDSLAPPLWSRRIKFENHSTNYDKPQARTLVTSRGETVPLDPFYEAKAADFLRAGDLFWIVGRRV